eukprot:Blabericola_migrator_1__62@NODE_1014_length_5701_cov_211_092474_g696_i0_p5_GENE_NODE_1014_length_5701_cov_211_092474_g696_i0NODE_1014_length_5701_cov_211_092474_g696_i0_p5_ORF_typecomplete_len264_score24_99RTA1/PF04479_13/0_011DUF1240/PF06836_12/1_9e02DUF1240/PF06836_12/10_NODE_1014_length_5701_cov_211_092474_g696_i028123603
MNAKQRALLWTILETIYVVCIAGIVTTLLPSFHTQWYQVDLEIPGSMRPFSHNATERVALTTLWNLHDITIDLEYPVKIHHTVPVSKLGDVDFFGALFKVPAATLVLLQDIQKTTVFFTQVSCVTVSLASVAALCTAWITLRRILITRGRGWSSTAEKIMANYVLMFMTLCFLLQLLGALYYIITLKIDSQSLLPALVRGLKLVCLTHNPQACHILVRPRPGFIVYLGLALVQFLTALVTPLVAFDDKPSFVGELNDPLLRDI